MGSNFEHNDLRAIRLQTYWNENISYKQKPNNIAANE